MEKVLLVEDDETFHVLLGRMLRGSALMDDAYGVREAYRKFLAEEFDLVLVDLGLPDGSGLDLCQRIRQCHHNSHCILVVLSGNENLDAKTSAYANGVDDYLVKSFDPVEIKLKVEALLRRIRLRKNEDIKTESGPFVLENKAAAAYLKNNDTSRSNLNLSITEFRLLQYFVRSEGRVISRKLLMESVWGKGVSIVERNVDSYVSKLRSKIGVNGKKFITSVYGEGYAYVSQPDLGRIGSH